VRVEAVDGFVAVGLGVAGLDPSALEAASVLELDALFVVALGSLEDVPDIAFFACEVAEDFDGFFADSGVYSAMFSPLQANKIVRSSVPAHQPVSGA